MDQGKTFGEIKSLDFDDVIRKTRIAAFLVKKNGAGGIRTHAELTPLELKSNALTTRPGPGDIRLEAKGIWIGRRRE